MRRARSRSLATSRRLYFAVALGLVVAATALAGCGGASAGGQKQPGASSKPVGRIAEAHVEATIPGGWNVIHRPITGVLYPRQVLAAASFPVTFPHSPRGCRPSNVLSQMPADGALLQLIEYTPRAMSTPWGDTEELRGERPAATVKEGYRANERPQVSPCSWCSHRLRPSSCAAAFGPKARGD